MTWLAIVFGILLILAGAAAAIFAGVTMRSARPGGKGLIVLLVIGIIAGIAGTVMIVKGAMA